MMIDLLLVILGGVCLFMSGYHFAHANRRGVIAGGIGFVGVMIPLLSRVLSHS
jgi:hypothetical protein